MGEHKYNPTAQKAKEGLLPEKVKPSSKREQERKMYELVKRYVSAKTGIPREMMGDWP